MTFVIVATLKCRDFRLSEANNYEKLTQSFIHIKKIKMGQIKIESESLIIIAKEGDIKRILVPSDFSDNAMKAVMYAAEIAKKRGSCFSASRN